MAAPFATPDDLAGMWRTLTADEQTMATNLLRVASAIIRSRVPGIDARLTAATLDPDLPLAVAVGMVRRAMSNPAMLRARAAGPYSETYNDSVALQWLEITDAELALLQPALPGGGSPRTIFVTPGLGMPHPSRRRRAGGWW